MLYCYILDETAIQTSLIILWSDMFSGLHRRIADLRADEDDSTRCQVGFIILSNDIFLSSKPCQSHPDLASIVHKVFLTAFGR